MHIKMTAIHIILALNLLFIFNAGACAAGPQQVRRQVELPSPPDSLAGNQKIKWITEHYWDSVDMDDEAWLTDSASLEQAFATWSWIMLRLPSGDISRPASIMFRKASSRLDMLLRIEELAETYFDDPNSPYRNENIWIACLQSFLGLPDIPEEYRIRPVWQLESALKNRPGTPASDISGYLPDSETESFRLYSMSGKAVLLIFYEPGCPECERVEKYISGSEAIGDAVNEHKLGILAVYPGKDTIMWEKHLPELPGGWTVIHSPGLYESREYVIRATPTIYLLDRSMKVVLKDVSAEEAEQYISGNFHD
ncbi:MAG: DUF5106 domain-containing protein [Bacteroidetes bacterium]|uniref:DUF5106 domain-containing protein n=1 Tax=Candidatus Cryptobacteroides faecavium TaxID=2840762 RepID=A0A9D9NE08_9BACT|nr:DUF5106 domain-containing protein [Candidatus Cryptobacteroides faecavium]